MPTYGINGTTLNLEHLQLKFKNASAWQESDVLLAGEVGVELDTGKAKIGDGAKTWGQLGYSADPTLAGLISGLTERVGAAETSLTGLAGRMDTAEADIDAVEAKNTTQDERLDALEGITTISANSFSE